MTARQNSSKRERDSRGLPSTAEMMECLRRSGYMLESTVVRNLNAAGFFVDSNQAVQDERTGKSRELDIVAEFHSYKPDRRGAWVRTTLVIEVVNNSYPFILVTPRPTSANCPIDDYVRYTCTPSEEDGNPFLKHVDILGLRGAVEWEVHSQYCALTRKKANAELMACHPDDVHSSIQKTVEYSLDAIEGWSLGVSDNYWRLFFWQPVLVLRGDLFLLKRTRDAKTRLRPAVSGKLEYNFHYRGRPETMVVDVVTEPHLLDLLSRYVSQDEICEEQIFKLRASPKGDNAD